MSFKDTLKEKTQITVTKYQARYMLNLLTKDRKYSEKVGVPLSKEVEDLSGALIEIC